MWFQMKFYRLKIIVVGFFFFFGQKWCLCLCLWCVWNCYGKFSIIFKYLFWTVSITCIKPARLAQSTTAPFHCFHLKMISHRINCAHSVNVSLVYDYHRNTRFDTGPNFPVVPVDELNRNSEIPIDLGACLFCLVDYSTHQISFTFHPCGIWACALVSFWSDFH